MKAYFKKKKVIWVNETPCGVEPMQVKPVEKKTGDLSGSATEDGVEDVEVEGFRLTRLAQLHPALAPQLERMRQQLIDEAHELAPLKVPLVRLG